MRRGETVEKIVCSQGEKKGNREEIERRARTRCGGEKRKGRDGEGDEVVREVDHGK